MRGTRGTIQFSLMEGYLLEKFPIYKSGDDKDNPSGGTRVILYQLVPDEGDRFKFQRSGLTIHIREVLLCRGEFQGR